MEDFVTYEIAKKLKEKGFNNDCHAYYEPLKHCLNFSRVFKTNSLAKNYKCITAPTIEQVLKWLRDEKGIHITICVCGDGWFYEVINISSGKSLVEDYEDDIVQSYEEASIAGIEYVLNNLI